MSDEKSAHSARSWQDKVTIIKPSGNYLDLNLRELYDARHLLYALVMRDYKMRFRQTLVGIGWVVFQPIVYVLVFTLVMNKVGNVDTGRVPYPVYAFSGICLFQLYSKTLSEGSNCFITERNIVTKVYFPRLLMPLASCIGGLFDFTIIFTVLLVYACFSGYLPQFQILMLPFFVLLTMVASLGAALWLSTLNALYRDVRYVVAFLTQFMLFVTPVFYSLSSVPQEYLWVYALNPMVLPIEGLRWALLGVDFSHIPVLLTSGALSVFMLFSGLFFFRRMEQRVVDFL